MGVKYIVMCGAESTMHLSKQQGMRGLNRKTMRWQNFAKNAKFEVVKDPDVESGYLLLSDTDIVKEAIKADLLFMQGIRTECDIIKKC